MRIIFSILLVNLLGYSCLLAQSPSNPLFSINKKNVPVDEFIYLYEKNHKGKPDEFTQEKVEEYLDLYIKFKLKVEEARHRGMDTTSRFKKEFAGYKEALRKPYLPDNKLIDSLALLTYDRLKEEVKASHILIRLQPDASPEDTLAAFQKISDVKKRLDAGEDFGTLAVNLSEDPSAKTNEGSLGYFTALQMVYPFETGAYTTRVGAVSNPVRTRFGYHLIKVTDKRPALGEVEVSHLLIRTGKDRTKEEGQKLIFEVYDRLQGGMKWDELCKQYSEDMSTKDASGKLRPFGIGAMASVPEFERTAFSLGNPGEYSAPFSTQFGWHIVKLEQKIPLPAYKDMESSLKSRVSRDERMQAAKEKIQQGLRRRYAFVENTEVKKLLLATADSTLQQAAWKKPAGIDRVAFTLNGKGVKASDFFDYAMANQKQNKLAPRAYFNQLYESFVATRIEQEVEESLMKYNADYRYLSNEYYEGILLFDIMEKEVWNKASEDTIGQRNYFNLNTVNYTASERAQGVIYASARQEAIDALQKQIETDATALDRMVKEQGIRQEPGKFEKDERPVLSKIAWAPGLSKVELEGNYYLVKIDQILPAGPRTFEEAKGLLISDYQVYLENKWIEELRKKYPIKVNKKGKKYTVAKLVK
jgi:peptidyl-prolyl cis-trans isomerase SurA